MSIMINLLPDTRQIKQRNLQRRKLVTGIGVLVWAVCGGAIVLLMLTVISEGVKISTLNTSIAEKKSKLEREPGLIDALTTQAHLAALPGLYGQRVYLTKFFQAYSKANPQDVALTALNVNSDNTLTLTGSAKAYASVAKLVRALEDQPESATATASDAPKAFSNINISSVGQTGGAVSFTINAAFTQGVVTSGN